MPVFARNLLLGGLLFLVAAGAFGLGYRQGQGTKIEQGTAQPVTVSTPASSTASSSTAQAGSPQPHPIGMPTDSSKEMQEFLANRVTLMQKMTELRKASPSGAADPQLFSKFQKDNAALLQRQRELSEILAQQQKQRPAGVMPTMAIPSTASPEMKAYLAARNQLMREQIEFMKQHRTDDPATKQAAMEKWRRDNAARFQEIQQKGRMMNPGTSTDLSNPSTTPKNQ